MEIVFFVTGILIGGAAAWFWVRNQTQLAINEAIATEREAKTIALIRLEESQRNLEDQKKLLDKAGETFKTTFEALSGEALKSNNQAFLDLAKKSMDVVLQGAKGEFAEKTVEMKRLVTPLQDTLKRYEDQIHLLEKSNSSVESQIQSLVQSNQLLQKEANNLASAFKNPNVRGQWGQFSLKRIVELAGMTDHCDFKEQVSVQSADGRLQPDMVVSLPGGSQVVIDSKVVMQAYRDDYLTASEDEVRKAALMKHAQQMRKHMTDLSSKSYWSQFPKAPEFVVMFVPGESFVSAACEHDTDLIEDGIANRVILATPTTLIALLRSVAMGWRHEEVAKNAQQIAELGKQLYDRFSTFIGYLSKTRTSLDQSVQNFNKSVASLEGRILPSVRRFKDLGATGADDIPSVDPIDQITRPVESLEVTES